MKAASDRWHRGNIMSFATFRILAVSSFNASKMLQNVIYTNFADLLSYDS